MFLTSDQALAKHENGEDPPRHFMVISRPCAHPDTPARDGYIRGQYESVEFIREIPIKKAPKKSASTSDLLKSGDEKGHGRKRSSSTISKEAIIRNAKNNSVDGEGQAGDSESDAAKGDSGRSRGHTISFDKSRGSDAKGEYLDIKPEDDESEQNPIEWIMITRSDPGGSVPRFMIERGTPGGIVSDASKFLDWACAKDMDELESDGESGDEGSENLENGEHEHARRKSHEHNHEKDLHNWQTNGHLAGIEEVSTPAVEKPEPEPNDNILAAQQRLGGAQKEPENTSNGSGLYAMVTGAAGYAGEYIAAHAPQVITSHLPAYSVQEQPSAAVQTPQPVVVREQTPEKASLESRRDSVSSIGSASSVGSFTSALERYETAKVDDDDSSQRPPSSEGENKLMSAQDKELQKLSEKKRKLDEKLNKARDKELTKKREDTAKEEEAIRKAEEAHEKEVKKQEEKYRKEVEKLEQKKAKEARKAEEKRRKAQDKDERTRLLRELEEVKAENEMLRKEKDILRGQVGDLQAENTTLAARVGKLGAQGEEVLREVRQEVGKAGRLRASSLRSLKRAPSYKTNGSAGSGEKEKEISKLSSES
ncbi:putative Reticulocyte-binding protein 2 like protein a [Glarea lozoyensis 74030]|nr:putative Reticulocyte-binding protein 2 like protein a [Glarea lozoyensis 74030]